MQVAHGIYFAVSDSYWDGMFVNHIRLAAPLAGRSSCRLLEQTLQPDRLFKRTIYRRTVGKDRASMIKVKSRGSETAEQMLRRFKKMCEKEGLTKDIKRIAYYEKPSEKRRRRSRTGKKPSRFAAGGSSGGGRDSGSSDR
jgi:small subunit ribosomal protein S21